MGALVEGSRPVEPEAVIPEEWRQEVFARTRQLAPVRMTDGRWPVSWADWEEGYDPGSWLDRQVHSTRSAVFPLHGLDPLP